MMPTEATDRTMRSSRTRRCVRTTALVAAGLAGTAWAPASAMSDVGPASPQHQPRSDPATSALATELARARAATARYATDLDAAIADGYQIITPNMPQMGYHYLNPTVTDFDITNPPILVYVDIDGSQQLAAFEWVWPETPAEPPIDGATYGTFAAACHYADGTFIAADAEADCAPTNPDGEAPFGFWHPDLVTMHVWLWYPNPDGLFTGENPLVEPITGGGTSHSAPVANGSDRHLVLMAEEIAGNVEAADPLECADVGGLRHDPRCR